MLILYILALFTRLTLATFVPTFQTTTANLFTGTLKDMETFYDTNIKNHQLSLPSYLNLYALTGRKIGWEGRSVVYEAYHKTLRIRFMLKISTNQNNPNCDSLQEVIALKAISYLNINTAKYVDCYQSGHGVFFIL